MYLIIHSVDRVEINGLISIFPIHNLGARPAEKGQGTRVQVFHFAFVHLRCTL